MLGRIKRNIFITYKTRSHAYNSMNKVYEKIIFSQRKFHQAIDMNNVICYKWRSLEHQVSHLMLVHIPQVSNESLLMLV